MKKIVSLFKITRLMDQLKNHPLYRVHDLDSAMTSLWDFYRTRFLSLFIISLVMSLITQYSVMLVNIKELQGITDPEEMMAMLRSKMVPLLGLAVVSLLFSTILHYYILIRPVDEERNIVSVIAKSFVYFLPYLIIMILFAFAGAIVIVLGILALIVGVFFAALYLGMISFFFLPVLMAEGPDIGRAIVRTLRLSHRNFWPNMGWSAVIILIYLVLSMVLSGIIMIPFAGNFLKTMFNPAGATEAMGTFFNPLFLGLSALANALIMPLLPIFSFILYFNGRAREEGGTEASSGGGSPDDRVKVEDLYAKD